MPALVEQRAAAPRNARATRRRGGRASCGAPAIDRLHRRILAVEDAQRIGVQPALRVGVERVRMALEIRDQLRRDARARSSALADA